MLYWNEIEDRVNQNFPELVGFDKDTTLKLYGSSFPVGFAVYYLSIGFSGEDPGAGVLTYKRDVLIDKLKSNLPAVRKTLIENIEAFDLRQYWDQEEIALIKLQSEKCENMEVLFRLNQALQKADDNEISDSQLKVITISLLS